MMVTKDEAPVKSDETLITILEVLQTDGPVTLSRIADEVGVAKSTVYNHLATLEQRDCVVATDDGYHFGLRFLEYGLTARRKLPFYQVAQPKVDDLAKTTGELAWCIVEEHGQAVYVYGSTGEHSIETREREGMRRPMHCLAAGKTILAHLPGERVDEIIDTHGLEQVANDTVTDRDELENELADIRECGVAYNHEESMPGLHAIAAPVLTDSDRVHGAISVAGPANRLTRDCLENELADLIRGATNEIEINLRSQETASRYTRS